jgi:hypothetical protein
VTLAHDWPGWVLAPKIQKVMMRLPKDRTVQRAFASQHKIIGGEWSFSDMGQTIMT